MASLRLPTGAFDPPRAVTAQQRIAKLAAGDSLAPPPAAVTYLPGLGAFGVFDEMVDAERDAWIL